MIYTSKQLYKTAQWQLKRVFYTMTKLDSANGRINKFLRSCKHIFWQATQEEINANMSDNSSDLGPDDVTNTTDDIDNSRSIEAGKRTERWFAKLEERTKQNRQRSIQNKNLAQRIDYRTVWIARILVGLLATLVATAIFNALMTI